MRFRRPTDLLAVCLLASFAVGANAQTQGVRGVRGVTRRTPTVVHGQNAAQFFTAGGLPLNPPTNAVAVPGGPTVGGGVNFGRVVPTSGTHSQNASQWAAQPRNTGPVRPGMPLLSGGFPQGRQPAGIVQGKGATNPVATATRR